MTDRSQDEHRDRNEILTALDKNRQRRGKAKWETDQARAELSELLARGVSLPSPVKIAAMARAAHISRETAHKLLRRRAVD